MKRYKNNLKLIRKPAGLAIVGVLVASTIGAVAILGLSQLSSIISRQAQRAQQMFNFNQLSEEIKQTFVLGRPLPCNPPPAPCRNTCTSSLTGYDADSPRALTIRAPTNTGTTTDLYWGGQPPEQTKDIKIQQIKYEPVGTPPVTQGKVHVHFSISDDPQETLTTPLSLTFDIDLNSVDASRKIEECSVAGASVTGTPTTLSVGCRKVIQEQSLVGCGGTEDNTDTKGTAFGYKAGQKNVGSGNTFFGYETGKENTKGMENSFFGYNAGENNFINSVTDEGGSFNTFLGYEAGKDNIDGFHNIAIGSGAITAPSGKDTLNIGNLIEGTVLWTPRDQTKYPPANPALPEVTLKGQVEIEPPLTPSSFITAITEPSLSITGEVWVTQRNSPAPEFKMSTEGTAVNPSLTFITDRLKVDKSSAGAFTLSMEDTTADPKVKLNAHLDVKGPSGASDFALSVRGGMAIKGRSITSDLLQTTVSGANPGLWNITNGNLAVEGGGSNKTSYFHSSLNIEKNLTVDETGTFQNITVKENQTLNGSLNITTEADLATTDLTSGYTISNATMGNFTITSLNANSHSHSHNHAGRYALATHPRNPSFPACVNRCVPCVPSSRTLKRNIKPFQDYEKSLENILNTPVFTWKYKKDKGDLSEKIRRGVISEELPKDLQILEKDKPSTPDWPSIYGTLWAGIKALAKQLQNFTEKTTVNLSELSRDFKKQFSESLSSFKGEMDGPITQVKKQLTKLGEKSQRQKQQVSQNNEDLEDLKKQFQKTNLILKKSEEELKDLLNELENARKELKELLSRKKKKSISKSEPKKNRGAFLHRGI